MANILLVDDADITKMMLRDCLEKGGHIIIGDASNGREALEKYKELKPDVVLMDINMPEVDGVLGVELIIEYDKKARIIVCSALGQKNVVLNTMKIGAKAFIKKPFDIDKIVSIVNGVLNA